MINVVKLLRFIFYPVAAPVAYMLDLMLGQELGTVYDRAGLKVCLRFLADQRLAHAQVAHNVQKSRKKMSSSYLTFSFFHFLT